MIILIYNEGEVLLEYYYECVHLQAVCFLPKDMCDVRKVEIARAVRLCKATVEPIFFKVPRTRVSQIYTTPVQFHNPTKKSIVSVAAVALALIEKKVI